MEDEIREEARGMTIGELETATAGAAAEMQRLEAQAAALWHRSEEPSREFRLAVSNATRSWKAWLEALMIRKRGFAGTTGPSLI
jgi:hypothetical protein